MRKSLSKSTTVKLIKNTNAVHNRENIGEHIRTFQEQPVTPLDMARNVGKAFSSLGNIFGNAFKDADDCERW